MKLLTLILITVMLSACGGGTSSGGNDDNRNTYQTTTYVLQLNNLQCNEFFVNSETEQNNLTSAGAYPGVCITENSLGSCSLYSQEYSAQIKVVYYPDDQGLITGEALQQACNSAGGSFESGTVVLPDPLEKTYVIQNSDLACTEQTTSLAARQSLIESSGGVEGSCARSNALGVCVTGLAGEDLVVKTIYYPDTAGLRKVEDLVEGCEHIGGSFIYGADISEPTPEPNPEPTPEPTPDVTAPVVTELLPIGVTRDLSPSYTFNVNEAGQINWQPGACSSDVTEVNAGTNNIELSTLSAGRYNNCSFTVKDASGNESALLTLTAFTIVATDSDFDGFADFVELEYETDPEDASSTPMSILGNAVNFSDDNDLDGFSDALEAWYFTDPNDILSHPVDADADGVPDGFDSSTDSHAPQLLGFDILESRMNIETGGETLTFNITIVDDLSGIQNVSVRLSGPSGQYVYVSHYVSEEDQENLTQVLSLESGAFGAFAEAGTWRIDSVFLEDVAGNSKSFSALDLEGMEYDSSVLVINDSSDTNPPTLSQFSIAEDEIDVQTGTETVSFNLTVVDDLSGIHNVSVRLSGPTGQYVYVSHYVSEEDQENLTQVLSLESGAFGEFVEAGTWRIDSVFLEDVAGNSKSFSASDLDNAGFESSTIVNN